MPMSIDRIFEAMANDTERTNVVPISLFAAVLCLCIVVGHLLKESRWVNESITAIVIGCITGTVILLLSKGRSSHILRFDEELFFIYQLPPIIFNAGFQVKKEQFFQSFLTIKIFGAAGVFTSSLIISVDETPRLYSLVFGEGVVNDATAVVIFNAIQKVDVSKIHRWTAVHFFGDFLYLFSTSTVLGIADGLSTAYVLKALYLGSYVLWHSTDREISLMILMAYLSYMMAELLQLSGILTVFFCGIVMSHYAWHNVSENSRISTRK